MKKILIDKIAKDITTEIWHIIKMIFVENDLIEATKEIQDGLSGVRIFIQGTQPSCPAGMSLWDPLFEEASEEAIPRSMRDGIQWRDPCCYIYTSGTTGRL